MSGGGAFRVLNNAHLHWNVMMADNFEADNSEKAEKKEPEGRRGACEDSKKAEKKEPEGRRGACSFIYNDKFYLYIGVYTFSQRSTAKLEVLDMTSGCWTTLTTEGDLPQCLSGACCTITNDCLYIFGGWVRNADVHELNLSTLTWRKLLAINPGKGPMLKDKAGIVAYGKHMLCVFGGYGYLSWDQTTGQSGATYHPDPEYGMEWTNELHLFHVPTCTYGMQV